MTGFVAHGTDLLPLAILLLVTSFVTVQALSLTLLARMSHCATDVTAFVALKCSVPVLFAQLAALTVFRLVPSLATPRAFLRAILIDVTLLGTNIADSCLHLFN